MMGIRRQQMLHSKMKSQFAGNGAGLIPLPERKTIAEKSTMVPYDFTATLYNQI
jgi:hypothetical protein